MARMVAQGDTVWHVPVRIQWVCATSCHGQSVEHAFLPYFGNQRGILLRRIADDYDTGWGGVPVADAQTLMATAHMDVYRSFFTQLVAHRCTKTAERPFHLYLVRPSGWPEVLRSFGLSPLPLSAHYRLGKQNREWAF